MMLRLPWIDFEHPEPVAQIMPQDSDPVATYALHGLAIELTSFMHSVDCRFDSCFPDETKSLEASLSKGGLLRIWQKYPHITQILRSTRPPTGRYITTTMTARTENASKVSIAKMAQVENRCARSATSSGSAVGVPGAANAAAPQWRAL
jgi:hypothetical protein